MYSFLSNISKTITFSRTILAIRFDDFVKKKYLFELVNKKLFFLKVY